jgi:hypothetical protein
MVTGLFGAPRVVITEQMELVPLLRTNLRRNQHHFKTTKESIEATALHWDQAETEAFCDTYGDFDIVLSCDCIYEPLYGQSWRALAHTIDVLCRRNPKCLALVSIERRNKDGVDSFLEFLQSDTSLQALCCAEVPKETQGLCDEGQSVEIYRMRRRVCADHQLQP